MKEFEFLKDYFGDKLQAKLQNVQNDLEFNSGQAMHNLNQVVNEATNKFSEIEGNIGRANAKSMEGEHNMQTLFSEIKSKFE